MSKDWNCSYINKPHTWVVDANQEDTGDSGVRVHCSECPQVDTLMMPYGHRKLEESREIVAEVANTNLTEKK